MKRAVVQCTYCHAISVVLMTEIDFDYDYDNSTIITYMKCPVCEQQSNIRLVQSIPEYAEA